MSESIRKIVEEVDKDIMPLRARSEKWTAYRDKRARRKTIMLASILVAIGVLIGVSVVLYYVYGVNIWGWALGL